MERSRTKQVNGNGSASRGQLLQVFSELTNRLALASQMGFQYRGARDLYQALGYPTRLTYDDYYARYLRQDMAKAIIDRPVKASWKGALSVIEDVKPTNTQFETEWNKLFEKLKLKSLFIRADKLTGIGEYSIILLGLNDVRSNDDFKNPVKKSNGLKLLYAKPVGQAAATIDRFDENITSERYGLPLLYKVKTSVPGTLKGHKQMELTVHYTRVIHLVEDVLEDEVYGTPRLQAVYNRLMDLEKLVGGDAEMFWRGARPGYTGKLDPDFQITSEGMEELKNQIDEFEHNLRRILVNEGVDYQALQQQIADPRSHVEVQMQMISAVTGIPKRILTGSERGELSSAQDKQEWVSYVASRREEQNEPMILRPFIDRCIDIGVLPKPKNGKYLIVWDKLFSLSDMDKVNMGKVRAMALREYSMNPMAQELMPFDLFCEFFLNMDQTQIERTMEENDNTFKAELPISEEEKVAMGEEERRDKKEYGDGNPKYTRGKVE